MSFISVLDGPNAGWTESGVQKTQANTNRTRKPLGKGALNTEHLVAKMLNEDPSDPIVMSSILTRHQKILPRRLSRLPRRDHKQFSTQVKRLRHLLILNTQSTPSAPAKLYPQKMLPPLGTKKRLRVQNRRSGLAS